MLIFLKFSLRKAQRIRVAAPISGAYGVVAASIRWASIMRVLRGWDGRGAGRRAARPRPGRRCRRAPVRWLTMAARIALRPSSVVVEGATRPASCRSARSAVDALGVGAAGSRSRRCSGPPAPAAPAPGSASTRAARRARQRAGWPRSTARARRRHRSSA